MSRNVIEIVNIERKETTTRTTTNWNDIWEKNENRKIGSACDRRVFLKITKT